MEHYELFINSIRSEYTKQIYTLTFGKYREFMGSKDLFCGNNPREIEQNIIGFISLLKKRGLGHAAILNYVTAILSFYEINDMVLNKKKIRKFIPEYKKIKKDRGYDREEIHKLLDIGDERMRVVIYILASSGIRITALCSLRVGHLQKDKLIVYEGDNEEYITFITPECRSAIDVYLDMRKRYGENITDNSILIREQFDVRNPGKPKEMNRNILMKKIVDLCNRAGVDKSNIPACHGFRKFFATQCDSSKVDIETRERLLGHNIGLTLRYVKPTVEKMYFEYEKAINNLTINEENRLHRELEEVKQDQGDIALLKLEHKKDMKELREQTDKKLDRIISLMQENPKLAKVKKEVLSKI